MPFLRPIWTFFGTRAPYPWTQRARPIISHVCAKPGVHALSISTPTTTDTNISCLFATSEEYHSRGLCTSYVLPTHGVSAFPQVAPCLFPDPLIVFRPRSRCAFWSMFTGDLR